MNSFAEDITQEYDISIPFYHGSLEGARRQAQDEAEYLVVYLHCPTHENTPRFLKSVLGDDEVIAHLSDSALLYGTSVMTEEGWRLAQELGVTTFPAIVVIFKKKLVMRLQGAHTKQEFLSEWETCTRMWGGALAEEIAYRHERDLREQQRLQEELSVSAMEQADIERLAQIEEELKARREAALRAEAEREEEAVRQREEEAEATRRAEERQREEARQEAEDLERRKMTARLADCARDRLPAEPPADADAASVVLISLRSLRGKQHQRRFYREDHIDALLDFAVSQEENYDGSALHLVTGFPPKPMEWQRGETRIADVPMLCPRAVVIVRKA